MDERLGVLIEVDKPHPKLFMELGWDRKPSLTEVGQKHYRKFYSHELENVKEIMSAPTVFDVCEIKRGQSRGADDDNPLGAVFRMFSKVKTDDSGELDTEQVVGKFKGLVSVATVEHKHLYAESKAKLINKMYDRLSRIY